MIKLRPVLKRLLNFSIVSVLLSTAIYAPLTHAELTGEDRAAILFNAPVYKPQAAGSVCLTDSPGTGEAPAIDINLSGNDNVEKAYRFFRSKGLEPKAAAGIVGNAIAESGVNPKSKSRSGYRGIFQWDGKAGGRFATLTSWAQARGLDPESLEGQLEYAWYEAGARTNSPPGQKVTNTDGTKQQPDEKYAAWYWGRYYEVAVINGSDSHIPLTNVQSLKERMNNAVSVLAKFGEASATPPTDGSTPPNSNSVPTAALVSTCTSAPGENSVFVDGFEIFSQYDPAWKDLPYGTNRPGTQSTIGESGCGPSAMAMAITALTGSRVTPVETTAYADSKGLYIPGRGSSWAIVPLLAEHWGLKTEAVGKDLAKITDVLRKGGVVVTSGKGALPFTAGGHYIVIRAVTAEGKFKVGDSGHKDTSDKEWDPQTLIESTPGGSAYAVYKDASAQLD